jgi:hypothetical protein
MSGVLDEIDRQIALLHLARAYFPYLPPNLAGKTEFATAPYYQRQGFGLTFKYSSPLPAERIQEFNALGHWINQNFILRLYAALETHGIMSNNIRIDDKADGHDEVDILRRLRNRFGHGAGRYDPCDSEHKKLYERIVAHFKLTQDLDSEREGVYPIPIDQVLIPLAEGCKRYVQSKSSA